MLNRIASRSASFVLAVQPGHVQVDNNAVVAPHTEMEEVEVPALRDPGAEDGAPSFGSPASAMLVDDTGGMPHLENETQTTDAADTSADSRPSAG